MTRKISTFVIMACLASSLAFAGDKAKTVADDAKAEATQTTTADNFQQNGSSPCVPVMHNKKAKHNAKPAPSDQEREFDRVLQGIYG
jgi:hypothetical protein